MFQSLQTEIENHEPRIFSVVEVGQQLIDERHPQSEEFTALIDELMRMWDDLRAAIIKRDERLKLSDTAQQVGLAQNGTKILQKIVNLFSELLKCLILLTPGLEIAVLF